MGMFDWVKYKTDCPECGAKVSGFQTKEKDCALETLDPLECLHFYSSCNECSAWIDVERDPQTNEFRVTVDKNF